MFVCSLQRPDRVASAKPGMIAAVAALAVSTCVNAQTITAIDVLQSGHHVTDGLAVSGDGNTVSASSAPEFFRNTHSFRWTRSGQKQDVGALPNTVNTFALAISGDGTAMAGSCYGDRDFAFVWTTRSGMRELPPLPGAMYGADANGISTDASIVAGSSSDATGNFRAVRWTTSSGIQDLGILPGGAYSYGLACSASGGVVTGYSDSATGEHTFVWDRRHGMQELPSVVEGEFSAGLAISASGNVIAGYSGLYAAIWDRGVVRDLGVAPGGSFSIAYAISGNGQVVGGLADNADGDGVAMIWTAALGMVDLNTYFASLGVNLTGWHLDVTTGISSDGNTIVGIGMLNGQERGWVVDLRSRSPFGGTGRGRSPGWNFPF